MLFSKNLQNENNLLVMHAMQNPQATPKQGDFNSIKVI